MKKKKTIAQLRKPADSERELMINKLPKEIIAAIKEGPNADERFYDEWQRRELFATRIALMVYHQAETDKCWLRAQRDVAEEKLRFATEYGAICANCGFKYAAYKGRIIPCPLCVF